MIRAFSKSREHAFQVNNDQTWRRLGGELIQEILVGGEVLVFRGLGSVQKEID